MMKLSARTYRRWAARIALGLAVAVVATPAAQASTGDIGFGPFEIQAPAVETGPATADIGFGAFEVQAPVAETRPVTADIGLGRFEVQAPVVENGPATADIGFGRFEVQAPTPVPVQVVESDGFDLRDAAIGAAIALAAVLLLAAALLVVRRRSHLARV